MEPSSELGSVALHSMRVRITGVLPAQIRACLAGLSDDQIWWRPNQGSNSIGNLVLHISGAIMEFLCRRIGGFPYERNREAEFSGQHPLRRDQLLKTFDNAIDHASRTFELLPASRLADPSTVPAYHGLLVEDILGITVHMATHAGQIVFITKMLNEGTVNELWPQTHRQAGAWRT
jgi:hypothetical protein